MSLKRPEAETVLSFIENTILPLKQAADHVRDNPEKQHLLKEAEEAIESLQSIADEINDKIRKNPTPFPGFGG
jgi:hypothetical protein